MAGWKSTEGRRRTAAVLSIVLMLSIFASCGKKSERQAELDAAVEYLRQMESGDPDAVTAVIRRQEQERLAAERDALKEQLLAGEIDVWSQFQDYVILGDSRAVGYWYFGWLPEERCLTGSGDTIRKMEEHIPDIVALHPARMYVSYGINDINIGFWNSKEEYVDEFVRILGEVQAELPDIEIYVNSILEVQDWALSKGAWWKYAPEWNDALEEMCREHGYTFIDNEQLTAEHQEQYEADGIHFFSSFYPLWATNMILATYYRGAEEELEL